MALDAAREAWHASGMHTFGCSLSARAARQLQTSSGIESDTADRLLDTLFAEAGYTRITRGRDQNRLYLVDATGPRPVSSQHGAQAEGQLHPAVMRARELRLRAGLPASLVDVTVLSQINNLFENVGRHRRTPRRRCLKQATMTAWTTPLAAGIRALSWS